MYLLAALRKIVRILTDRYRPELHYMRGPDPHECSNVVKLLGINVYRKTIGRLLSLLTDSLVKSSMEVGLLRLERLPLTVPLCASRRSTRWGTG
jgi:hypothetical protein